MPRMRIRITLVGVTLGSLLGFTNAQAVEPARPAANSATTSATPTDTQGSSESPQEPHRFPLVLQGVLGATSLSMLVAGGALVGSVEVEYKQALAGGSGDTCRPCTGGQIASLQGREYGGYALIGIGAVLAVTDIALIVLDTQHVARLVPREAKLTALRMKLQTGWRF